MGQPLKHGELGIILDFLRFVIPDYLFRPKNFFVTQNFLVLILSSDRSVFIASSNRAYLQWEILSSIEKLEPVVEYLECHLL